MKTSVIEIRPNRDNWEQFCSEPPLTLAEGAAWYEMGTEAMRNDTLVQFLDSRVMRPEPVPYVPDDWSGTVEWADRHRRWHRAVIAAWVKWQQREGGSDRNV